ENHPVWARRVRAERRELRLRAGGTRLRHPLGNASGLRNGQRPFSGRWGPSFVLATDETRISCRRPAASEGRAPTDDRSWCHGTSAGDRREQFLAAIPQTQLVSCCGRSGERRFQGFGSHGTGPRGCSSAPGIVAQVPIEGTSVGEAPIASSKTIGIARRG